MTSRSASDDLTLRGRQIALATRSVKIHFPSSTEAKPGVAENLQARLLAQYQFCESCLGGAATDFGSLCFRHGCSVTEIECASADAVLCYKHYAGAWNQLVAIA